MEQRRKNNNESVKKSREKKKKTIEEKTELYEQLKVKTQQLEQLVGEKKLELEKIQQTMFNGERVKDFGFIQDDRELIKNFDLKNVQS